MSSAATAIGWPEIVDSREVVASAPSEYAMSKLVPPMSIVMKVGFRLPVAAARPPTTPAAGPESTVCTAR